MPRRVVRFFRGEQRLLDYASSRAHEAGNLPVRISRGPLVKFIDDACERATLPVPAREHRHAL